MVSRLVLLFGRRTEFERERVAAVLDGLRQVGGAFRFEGVPGADQAGLLTAAEEMRLPLSAVLGGRVRIGVEIEAAPRASSLRTLSVDFGDVSASAGLVHDMAAFAMLRDILKTGGPQLAADYGALVVQEESGGPPVVFEGESLTWDERTLAVWGPDPLVEKSSAGRRGWAVESARGGRALASRVAPLVEVPSPVSPLWGRVFVVSLAIGLALPLLLYGVWFNRLSETRLVQLSFYWVPFFGFGFYGVMARRWCRLLSAGRANRIAMDVLETAGLTCGFGLALLAPLAIIAVLRRPVAVAFAACALLWMGLIVFYGTLWQAL
jgi:hypothetical protein